MADMAPLQHRHAYDQDTNNIYAPVWTKLTSAQGIVDNWYNKTTAFAGIPGGFWDGSTHDTRSVEPSYECNFPESNQ